MPFTRLLIVAGVMFFGAIAVFMGAAVSLNALSTGSITYSYGEGSGSVSRTAARDGQPDQFWQRVAMFGGLPMVLGAGGLWWGRRQLRR